MEVRTALATTTNTTGVLGSGAGGAEINKMIDKIMVDFINREVEFSPMVSRIPMDQLAHVWNIKTNLGSTEKAAFYGDGATGTPYPSNKTQLYAVAKSFRADYEVTGLMMAGSASYYNALEDESKDALSALKLLEEKSILCGTDTSAYGYANAFLGLLQLMGSNATFGDTDTIYGVARTGARDELDVSLVAAAGSGLTADISLDALDASIRVSNTQGARAAKRLFLCSYAMHDAINALLQGKQQFVAPSLEVEGGFTLSTYKRIPILGSRFMDKNGITWSSPTKTASHADNSMYLLDMDNIKMGILKGIDAKHVPIMGADASQRSDVEGGFFKTYGTFIMKKFNTQVLIYNITAP